MKVVATLPPFVALQLLDELEAAGISAQSTDMAPGVGIAAYPGLLETTATVWVLEESDLADATRILEEMRGREPDLSELDDDDVDEIDDPERPDESTIVARRRNAYLLVLLLWTGPIGVVVILVVFALLFGGVG